MTGVPDDVLREKIMFIEEFREIYSRRMSTLNQRNYKNVGRGRYPVIEFDSKITSKIVTCLLTLFLWYVSKPKKRHREAQPRPQGAFPAPPPKPGKSALGTRLREACGISLRGVLYMMAYTGRLRPKRVPFSGFRYMKD